MDKWKILSTCGFMYVCFAILTAYDALGRNSTPYNVDTRSRTHETEVSGFDPLGSSFDIADESTVDISNEYFIEVWISTVCAPCDTFKQRELPRLKKSGFRYMVFNLDIFPKPTGVKVTPTIRVYRGDILIKQFDGLVTYEEIMQYVSREAQLLQ